MSPRKSEEDAKIKFCKSQEGQKQPFADILQNRCPSKFRKSHWKTPVLESLLNKVHNRLQRKCFFVKFCKFLRTSFFTEYLRRLLLEGVCEGTSLVKILQFRHFDTFGINHRCFRNMPIKKNSEKPQLLKCLSFFLLSINKQLNKLNGFSVNMFH